MESNAELSPQAQLDAIGQVQSSVADRLITPWWYHPILGTLTATYTVAFSLGNNLVRVISVVVFFASLGVLVQTYKRMTGVWISGFDAGRASRWAYALSASMVAGLLLSVLIAWNSSLAWPSVLIAAVMFILIIVFGRQFDNALRRQLRQGQ